MKTTDPDTRQDGPVTGTDAPWHQADLVALDLEGSGAQDRDHEAILEIALVPLTAGKPAVAEAYATLKNGGLLLVQQQFNKGTQQPARDRRARELATQDDLQSVA